MSAYVGYHTIKYYANNNKYYCGVKKKVSSIYKQSGIKKYVDKSKRIISKYTKKIVKYVSKVKKDPKRLVKDVSNLTKKVVKKVSNKVKEIKKDPKKALTEMKDKVVGAGASLVKNLAIKPVTEGLKVTGGLIGWSSFTWRR